MIGKYIVTRTVTVRVPRLGEKVFEPGDVIDAIGSNGTYVYFFYLSQRCAIPQSALRPA